MQDVCFSRCWKHCFPRMQETNLHDLVLPSFSPPCNFLVSAIEPLAFLKACHWRHCPSGCLAQTAGTFGDMVSMLPANKSSAVLPEPSFVLAASPWWCSAGCFTCCFPYFYHPNSFKIILCKIPYGNALWIAAAPTSSQNEHLSVAPIMLAKLLATYIGGYLSILDSFCRYQSNQTYKVQPRGLLIGHFF